MSDSSRVQLGYIKEATWGVTPAAALKALRYTKETLKQAIQTATSSEVRADRQVSDIIRTGANAQGTIECEFSHSTYQEFLEGAVASVFGAPVTITSTSISAVAATQSFNGSGLPVYAVGQWVRVAGFALNNGFYQVVTSSTTSLVVGNGSAAIVNEATGPSVTIDSTTITNGTVATSYTLEKFFSDLNLFWAFRGMRLNTLEIVIASRSKITMVMDFFGISGTIISSTIGSGAYTSATTTSIMNAVNNVGRMVESGSVLPATTFVKSAKIKFANNLRPQDAVGNLNPIGVGYGRCEVTGELIVYFKDETIANRYLATAGADSGVALLLSTPVPENDAYVITIPSMEYTNADVTGVGNDNDVLLTMEFHAKMHPSQNITARIDSFT